MQVEVLLFGQLADIVGTNKFHLQNIPDTDTLGKKLHEMYPALAKLSYSIAVNKKTIHENTIFDGDADIALLPPFSGG
ncbi:MoaD/ThiS family protein [Daejeonella sp.]|jgi:molybdopterin synthase sulfur carrier subunit|uniref:MoaD/ThiS family protein n=1 Tax=Daejeonella sp. TaxID=2805397 RepID=UPI003783735D